LYFFLLGPPSYLNQGSPITCLSVPGPQTKPL
jgi:hypothetical protein